LGKLSELRVRILSNNNLTITNEDILALEKVIELVREFSNKNPIRKEKINYDKIIGMLDQIKQDENSRNEVFFKVLRKLKFILKREIHPELFFIVGGHGGIIIGDVGFCEFDAPKFAIDRLMEKMKLSIRTQMPYNLEIAVSCLEWLNKNYPETINEFKRLFNQGRFEIINPMYSQPYNLIIGPESNIKQLEYGIRVLNHLGLQCKSYYCSEASLHPQVPQLLKGFNIVVGSLRTRLLGTSPTTHSGHVKWIGLDSSPIEAITDQASVFNGEYWHGTFFRELPNMLFQAVARPFMNHMIFSSIEDFIMPLPYQEEVWSISQFSELFGRFIGFSELLQLIKVDGEFKFTRDDFYLGDYIFVPSELFRNNKICEAKLISAEILHSILGIFSEESKDALFDSLWKNLLLTQAHDNYAVPYIRSGDYSAQQLSDEEYKQIQLPDKKVAISELSLQLQKEIQDTCDNLIAASLNLLVTHLGTGSSNETDSIHFFIFNPTAVLRRDVVTIPVRLENASKFKLESEGKSLGFQYQDSVLKFIAEIPPLGYRIYTLSELDTDKAEETENYVYQIQLSKDSKSIEVAFGETQVFQIKFQSISEYHLSIDNHYKDSIEDRIIISGKRKDNDFNLQIIQYNGINRLEFLLKATQLKEIVLIPSIPISKSIVNYPFGIEETKRSKIQTLDFLLLVGEQDGILYMVKNSQRFLIDRSNFTIRNIITPNSKFEFAITIPDNPKVRSAIHQSNAFQFKLLGVKFDHSYEFPKKSGSFLSIPPPIILINLWIRKNQSYLRLFNPSYCDQELEISSPFLPNLAKEIDFTYEEVKVLRENKISIRPWKIVTLKL